MTEIYQDTKELNYDTRDTYCHQERTCNWKKCVEEFQTGSRMSMQMLRRETICEDSL